MTGMASRRTGAQAGGLRHGGERRNRCGAQRRSADPDHTGAHGIANAIDEARRIFARITSYTLYRIALTINIMVLVVMSTIVFGFKPLTAVMIVILALLDDAPIMAIAYDNTEVARQPIRWRITRLLVIASAIAVFVAAETFGLLLIG